MNIDPKIFKAYDIRGLYPEQINEQNFSRIISAIILFLNKKFPKKKLNIVLGRDMRLSSPDLFSIAKRILLLSGVNVIDIGLATTPTVYFTAIHHHYDGGIQISASHNPKNYNGVKFFYINKDQIIKISKNTGMSEVKELAVTGATTKKTSSGHLTVKKNVLKEEVDFAYNLVKPIHLRKIKIVADAANAMGKLYLEEIFQRFDCQLIKMNFKLDGSFPSHEADPLKFKNLVDLQKKVVKEKADLGIEPDGDGDRVFFVDEKGGIIPASLITSLVAREILRKKSHEKIICDIRYLRNVKKVVEDNHGRFEISPVGHALITEMLNKSKAAFAGESSGHFYFRETGGGESSIRIIYYVLEAICRENKPVSEIVNRLKSTYESGEFNFKLPEKPDVSVLLNRLIKHYHQGSLNKLDGISLDFPDWRFNVRISNTEGLLRLNAEGDSKNSIKNKIQEIKQIIIEFGAEEKI